MVAAIIICFVLIGLLFWILAANNRNFAMDIESLCSEVTQLRAEIDALKKVDDAHYNDMAKFDGILSKLEARVVELESKQVVRKVITKKEADPQKPVDTPVEQKEEVKKDEQAKKPAEKKSDDEELAQRRKSYAKYRKDGLSVKDAAAKLGIALSTAKRYEKYRVANKQ